jgi:hypothetical protein
MRTWSYLLACIAAFHANAAFANEVCKPDKNEALVEAIAFHSRVGLEGGRTKGLPPEALKRAQWCGTKNHKDCTEYFKSNAWQYVKRFNDSALVLYARDTQHTCAFLFTSDGHVEYARHPIEEKALDGGIEQLRLSIAGEYGRKVSAALRKRLTALRDGQFDSCAIPPADESSNISGTADVLVDEAQITRVLFPNEFLGKLGAVKHLSIVPFGPITTLPISAMAPFGDDRQVVDLFSINYLLFAGEVAREPLKWTGPPTNPLIFGNPIPTDSKRAQCVTPLPEAEKEALLVHHLFGGTHLQRERATVEAFREGAKTADMIYFASHGLAGLEDGIGDSFIALADANLTARDIQDYSRFALRARLVVMSACQTGLGKINEFGVIGLARTFLDTGVENTVMSLWNVDDEATRILMSEFSRQLKTRPPAEALQIAQKYLRQQTAYRDPVNWAGFGVYGNQMTAQ